MRIDSHVLYSREHPPEHLGAILARNRFDGAVLFGEWVDLPHIVGFVIPLERLAEHRSNPKLRGVLVRGPLDMRMDLPVDLDIQPNQLELVEAVAAQAPRVVIDHLGRPDFAAGLSEEWLGGMQAAARLPNVYCKISGLVTNQAVPWTALPIRPFVQHVLNLFGPKRVMFGSEWPASLPTSTWKESLAAFTQAIGAHPMEVREQLLGATAQEFYGLE